MGLKGVEGNSFISPEKGRTHSYRETNRKLREGGVALLPGGGGVLDGRPKGGLPFEERKREFLSSLIERDSWEGER